ncbi:MAG: hypothetical protein Q8R74_05515 [Methylophilus sp.]|nr:hypothetical protein [Methylophilus sp.]
MKHWIFGLGLFAVIALPACVTINIYFPAAAAEKAADKIIDEVWQLKDEQSGAQPQPADTPANPAE